MIWFVLGFVSQMGMFFTLDIVTVTKVVLVLLGMLSLMLPMHKYVFKDPGTILGEPFSLGVLSAYPAIITWLELSFPDEHSAVFRLTLVLLCLWLPAAEMLQRLYHEVSNRGVFTVLLFPSFMVCVVAATTLAGMGHVPDYAGVATCITFCALAWLYVSWENNAGTLTSRIKFYLVVPLVGVSISTAIFAVAILLKEVFHWVFSL